MRFLAAGTVPSITYDAASTALVLGIVTRLLTALSTKLHDKTARSLVAGALIVVGSMVAYVTNATGDIAIFPDLVIVGAIAFALVIGVDRGLIGQVFALVDRNFPGFWKVDPNSVGIGRSAEKLYAKHPASSKSHPAEGGTTGDPMLDALGPPDVDAATLVPPTEGGATGLPPR